MSIKQSNLNEESIKKYLSPTFLGDRVVLVEEREISAKIKINLIENAKKSLDISYFQVQKDEAGILFFAGLIEAAKRGVKVRILLDGKCNKIKYNLDDTNLALLRNPNIEIKYYDPLNIFNPKSWNNILHDKYIVVDNKIAIIGGRNIGNQYFAFHNSDYNKINDREVLIYTNNSNFTSSAVVQIEDYFNLIWQSKYSKVINIKMNKKRILKADNKINYFESFLKVEREKYKHLFNNEFDWDLYSIEVNKISLIYNSINRGKKEPSCWKEIIKFFDVAKENIIIQSPYIIFSKAMKNKFKLNNYSNKSISVITNSAYSTLDLLAFTGYLKHKKSLMKNKFKLYEYQGEKSSIHGKSYVFDDNLSIVGSFNLDPRSVYLSTETMLIIDSVKFNQELRKKLNILIDDSVLVNQKNVKQKSPSLFKRIILVIFSILTYFFNFLL
jgi:putative cardiolipin synthase